MCQEVNCLYPPTSPVLRYYPFPNSLYFFSFLLFYGSRSARLCQPLLIDFPPFYQLVFTTLHDPFPHFPLSRALFLVLTSIGTTLNVHNARLTYNSHHVSLSVSPTRCHPCRHPSHRFPLFRSIITPTESGLTPGERKFQNLCALVPHPRAIRHSPPNLSQRYPP